MNEPPAPLKEFNQKSGKKKAPGSKMENEKKWMED